MYRKIIWPILLVASIFLIGVFIAGFVTSINISKGSRSDTTGENENATTQNTQESAEIATSNILILGDSIGYGFGDDSNQGIGGRYITLLDPEGIKDIKLTNLAIPGAKVAELAALVNLPENESAISSADLIIISIGGNDLNNLDYQDALSLDVNYQEMLNQYKENLQAVIDKIRELSQSAPLQIAIIGLYDPYNEEDPYKTGLLLNWNYETQRIAASDVRTAFIPTYDLFKYNLDAYLAFDKFHPGNAGYQAIAEELVRILHGINMNEN